MGFKIDDMIGRYNDFARNYMFYARVTPPGGVAIDSNHPYLVSSTTLPVQTIEAISTSWQGMEYKIGGVSTFAEFSMTFKSDTAHALRASFLQWMAAIHNPVSNAHGLPIGYFGEVGLSQLNTQGEPIMSYKLVHAWPSSVGEITLDYTSKEVSTFQVTFTYTYHVVDSIHSARETGDPVTVS